MNGQYVIAFATAALMLYATAMPTRTLNGSLVDIGANVLERMINNSYYHPHSDDKAWIANFKESICPLFKEYNQISATLDNMDGNHTSHADLSLLVLVAEKVLTDTCEYAMDYFSDGPSFNCKDSLSQICLHSQVQQLHNDIKTAIHSLSGTTSGLSRTATSTAYWLAQLFSDSLMDNSLRNVTLDTMREIVLYDCSINDNCIQCEAGVIGLPVCITESGYIVV